MVAALDERATVATAPGRRPAIVEFVGPSGAGKTSLARIMGRRSAIAVANPPNTRCIRDAPFFVRNTLSLLPALVAEYRPGTRWSTRAEIGSMAILNGWQQVIYRRVPTGTRLIIVDQGPVFILGQLCRFNPASLARPRLQRWWKQMCDQWAAQVSMVIWLDAGDADLLQRIRARTKRAPTKIRNEVEGCAFLASQRLAYRHVISVFQAYRPGPRVLRFDTGAEPLDEIATRILSA